MSPDVEVAAHPFRTEHIFHSEIRIKRAETLPSDFKLGVSFEIALGREVGEASKRFNVLLRFRTDDESKERIDAEVVTVAIFTHLEDGEPLPEQVANYLNNLLLSAMVSRVIQLVATLTAQMGMAPVWLPMPRGFGYDPTLVGAIVGGGQDVSKESPETTAEGD